MKKKISIFLAVVVLIVAVFSVPAMAADEVIEPSAVTASDIQKLASGDTIIRSETYVNPDTGNVETLITEIGPAPESSIKGRAIGTHNGVFFHKITRTIDPQNYAYSRVEFSIDAAKTKITGAWQAKPDPAAGYYPYGSLGGVSIVEIAYNNPDNVLSHNATFAYQGGKVKFQKKVLFKNGVLTEMDAGGGGM